MVSFALVAASQSQEVARVDNLGDPLPSRALLRMGTERFRSPGVIYDMVLADNDRVLVTAGDYLTAWDAETGKQLWRQSSRAMGNRLTTSYGVRCIDAMPDGMHVVTQGPGGDVLFWDVRTGKSEPTEIHAAADSGGMFGAVSAIDVSSDGKLFAVGNGRKLRIQNRAGEALFDIEENFGQLDPNAKDARGRRDRLFFGGPFHYGIFSPDAKILAKHACGDPKKVFLLNAETGQAEQTIQCKANAVRMDFSPDSKRIAITQRDTSIRMYDVSTGDLVWETTLDVDRTTETYTSAIKFSPDGKHLAVAERQQRLVLLDARSGKLIGSFQGHSWNPWAVAFSSDSTTLYSSGWGGIVHRWDVETLEQMPVPGAVLGTSVVAASHDGKWLAHVDQKDMVYLIDKASGKEVRKWKSTHGGCETLAFSHDGQLLAGGGAGDKVQVSVWEIASGKCTSHWLWPKGKDSNSGIQEIEFSRDGRFLAAASFRQDAAYLWELSTGKQVAKLKHKDVYGLSFTPASDKLLTAGWDKKVRCWDLPTANEATAFEIPESPGNGDERMYTVEVDPSGEMFATTQLMRRVLFWNLDDLIERGGIRIDGGFTFGSSCFSPDGLWFATGGSGKIQIWDPWSVGNDAEETMLFEFDGHEKHVYDIQFSGDNRTLVSGAASTSLLWNLRPEITVRSLSEHADSLVHANGPESYTAWWALVDAGDTAVPLLRERLPASRKLTNLGRMISGSAVGERDRRRALLMKMAASNKRSMRLGVAKRIVSVLSHIGSDSSIALLRELASQDDELGDVASQQLSVWAPIGQAKN
ncbi:translocation protein TolB [Planctomycetes bacterium K23_9]|uniref:Translocation protein TolB n=2 Tax=Stieleria marina TaxID=1930275 RepID=A0A517NQQ1_9BACT|nr:translocation protein TolB [Planctomycetes bacterium K23_9]